MSQLDYLEYLEEANIDHSGVRTELHNYWCECLMHRSPWNGPASLVAGEPIDSKTFNDLVNVVADDTKLAFHIRQKIKKFTAARGAA